MEKAASLKLVAFLAVLFCFVNIATSSRPHSKAIVVLDGSQGFKGTVSFYQEDGHHTVITLNLVNLNAGSHGFHVHEFGSTIHSCEYTGKHFNPFNKPHGDIHDHEEHRHYGDLGNVNVGPDGRASYSFRDKMISLSGPNSIIGRSLVIHENHDDGGKGTDSESKINGNAGKKVACGHIAHIP